VTRLGKVLGQGGNAIVFYLSLFITALSSGLVLFSKIDWQYCVRNGMVIAGA